MPAQSQRSRTPSATLSEPSVTMPGTVFDPETLGVSNAEMQEALRASRGSPATPPPPPGGSPAPPGGGAPPPNGGPSAAGGSSGRALSGEEVEALRTQSRLQTNSAIVQSHQAGADAAALRQELADARLRPVADFDSYEQLWREAGGRGEVPPRGFIGADGRPVIWQPRRPPAEYRAMMAAQAEWMPPALRDAPDVPPAGPRARPAAAPPVLPDAPTATMESPSVGSATPTATMEMAASLRDPVIPLPEDVHRPGSGRRALTLVEARQLAADPRFNGDGLHERRMVNPTSASEYAEIAGGEAPPYGYVDQDRVVIPLRRNGVGAPAAVEIGVPGAATGSVVPGAVIDEARAMELRVAARSAEADLLEPSRRVGGAARDARVSQAVLGTSTDYELYAGDWAAAGGRGEPPPHGFVDRAGRPVLWGRAEPPAQWRPGSPLWNAIHPHDPRARASAPASAHAPVVEPGAPAGAELRPGVQPAAAAAEHRPVVEPGAAGAGEHRPVVPLGPSEAPGLLRRAFWFGARVLGGGLSAYGLWNSARSMASAGRQGGAEGIERGLQAGFEFGSNALQIGGEAATLGGAEGAGGAMGAGALPLAVGAGAIAADRAGNDHARETAVLGRREGVVRTRGVGASDPANLDFDETAARAGDAAGGSMFRRTATAGVARLGLMPVSATYGLRQGLGNSGGRSDTTDLEARDLEERGAPLADPRLASDPAERAHLERLAAARHQLRVARARTQDAHRSAAERASADRDRASGTVRAAPGAAITEAMVQARQQAILRRWEQQAGGAPRIFVDTELDLAERQAREDLAMEQAAIR